jgi:hypothetical protein
VNLTGEKIKEVGYRDVNRLRISDEWGPELIEGMQNSAQAMHPHVREILKTLQLTQTGLPEDYPRIGIINFDGRSDSPSGEFPPGA